MAANEVTKQYRPNVDIWQTEESLHLWADLPGVDEHSLDVQLAEGVLTIEGRVALADYSDLTPMYTEYNVGDFHQSFRVPTEIDADRIRAKMANGVLELELPKADRAKPRRIEISS